MTKDLKNKIRNIPDWPKKGIIFRDLTTLLKDAKSFTKLVDLLFKRYKNKPLDLVVGIESRGLIIGGALANKLGLGFVPIRKFGKLPAETFTEEYELEYGTDKIQMHKDAIKKGQRVLLVDDLIATGGTAIASCKLIKKAGGEIAECAFVVDLPGVGGKKKLIKSGVKVFSLIKFEGE